jgi:predicted RNA-binding protein YlqC (UPF0109 family)
MSDSPFMTDGPDFERRAFDRAGGTLEGGDEDDGLGADDELEDDELEDDDLDDDDLDDEELEDEEGLDEVEQLDADDLDDESSTARPPARAGAPRRGEEDDGFGAPGNRSEGGAARAVLEHIARSIVDDPDAVVVDVAPGRSGVKLSLHVAPGDMGRIIGRRGRVAQAMRTVVRAAAASEGGDAVVDIVD